MTSEEVASSAVLAAQQDWDTRILIDRMPIGISRATLEGTILYANDALAHMLGFASAKDLIGLDASKMYQDPAQRTELVERLRAQDTLENIEVPMRTRQGETRIFLINFWRQADVLAAMLMDITDRKRSEIDLQVSRARLKSIIDSVMDAIISTDTAQRIVLFNHAAEQMFGCTAAEVIGHPLDDFLPERYRAGHARLMAEFANNPNASGYMGAKREICALRKNGEEFPAEASIAQVDAAGMKYFTVILRDITERKRAEGEAIAATQRLQVLSDASRTFVENATDNDAVLHHLVQHVAHSLVCACFVRLLSEDGQVMRMAAGHDADEKSNLIAKAVNGEMIWKLIDSPVTKTVLESGKACIRPSINFDLLRPLLPAEFWEILSSFKIKNTIWVPLLLNGQGLGILTLIRHDTELPPFNEDDLRLACDLADRATLAIGNARLFQQVQHELAERKQAESALEHERALLAQRVEERTADLNAANTELAQAARLKDEFLASMSHELRTPLNSVLGQAEALLEGVFGQLTTKQVQSIHGIEESGRHLLDLINDILDLAKIESGKLTLEVGTVEVEPLCTLSIRMVAQAAHQKQIKLITTIDNSVETIRGDERRLKQVLVNLLANAVKFTPNGGRIGLEVIGDDTAHTVAFTVWDTGIGIDEKDLPRLFKPFMQIDSSLTRKYTGTGLGLSLVRQLAEAHQGAVSVQSVPNRGSRFTVTLPWN